MSSITGGVMIVGLIYALIMIRGIREGKRRPIDSKICFGWFWARLDKLLAPLIVVCLKNIRFIHVMARLY